MIHAFLDYGRDLRLHIVHGYRYWDEPFHVLNLPIKSNDSGDLLEMERRYGFMNFHRMNSVGIPMVTEL